MDEKRTRGIVVEIPDDVYAAIKKEKYHRQLNGDDESSIKTLATEAVIQTFGPMVETIK